MNNIELLRLGRQAGEGLFVIFLWVGLYKGTST